MPRAGAIAVLVLTLALGACAKGPPAPPTYRGDPNAPGSVAKVERVGGYSALELRVLLWAAKLKAPVSRDIDLYRVSYWSTTDGHPVLVSGLMSPPRGGPLRGTVLWMHGTNDDRSLSVSKPSLQEGVGAAGLFAGGGYLLLAPDLMGLGVSHGTQAYLYNPSTVAVTRDFLRAAQRAAADLGRPPGPDLYVAGFSQGGHSAAVIQRDLEAHPDPPWRVRAGAGIEGAYDLADISFPFALQGKSAADSEYLTLLALSYATYEHRPLESVLTPGYAGVARRLLDGDHAEAAEKAMPADPRALFAPAFLAASDAKAPNWFREALRANGADGWAPKAPFRAYVASRDVDVPPADGAAFVAGARKLGGDAELVQMGPYDHGEAVLHAGPMARAWFDQLSEPRSGRE